MYSQLNDKNISADRLFAADILSSIANGTNDNPVSCSTLAGIPTRTTPTLTPTTLKNIEESFMELNQIPPAPLQHEHQAGFAPPVVTFPKQEENPWVDDCMQSSEDSPRPPSRPTKTGRSGGRRPNRDEKLSPEEEERRRVRRERNKLAAARCRKRRMELTSNLMNETDGLEEKKQSLHQEIQMLQQQKDELEFILEAHRANCKLKSSKKSRPDSLSLENMSCGGQQRSSGSSDLSSPDSYLPPKLVSL